jgi:hypothetical protein
MNIISTVRRLSAMDRAELLFRLRSEGRKALQRARYAWSPPAWDRSTLGSILDERAPWIADAARLARRGDPIGAHRALGRHFSERPSTWPLEAGARGPLADAVADRFPGAAAEAASRAKALAAGLHDLLGYRDVSCGTPPDWHRDHVNGGGAPKAFWATIPYLDPVYGDHKVIWELNRHQHFRALGRAFWLTTDERFRSVFVSELEDWFIANPPGCGINWASMLELAFRSLSWTWAVEFFCGGTERDDVPWLVDVMVGLDRQLNHIVHNLSSYFSPNTHLTGEALALYCVSRAFPELRESGARAALGRELLLRESTRQVCADGGHAERSAHYHRYSTDFYLLALLIARRSKDPAAQRFADVTRAHARFLRTIADDRGRLPLIGDDDGGQLFGICGGRPADASATLAAAASVLGDPALAVSPPSEEAYWILGEAPAVFVTAENPSPVPSRLLESSGYLVSRTRHGDHLIMDAGAHGYLTGGHSHSDALSVVLTVAGEPVLVDPGTATYTMNAAMRDAFRSTRMHNTVVIDGADHTEPRGPFGWQRFPEARILASDVGSVVDFAQATHDGYRHAAHIRSVVVLHGIGWLIADHVCGEGDRLAESFWHLHPMWTPSVQGRCVTLSGRQTRLAMAFTAGEISVMAEGPLAMFAPEYGRIETACTLRVAERRAAPFSVGAFVAATGRAIDAVHDDSVGLAPLPLQGDLPNGWHGAAFRIESAGIEMLILVAASAGDPAPGPGVLWGTSAVRTDARLAVLRRHDGSWRAVRSTGGNQVHVAADAGGPVAGDRPHVEAMQA